MHKPHRVELEELTEFFATKIIVGATAPTLDASQQKQLLKQGDNYLVRRRYFQGTDPEWETIYEGVLAGAVRSYNLLS